MSELNWVRLVAGWNMGLEDAARDEVESSTPGRLGILFHHGASPRMVLVLGGLHTLLEQLPLHPTVKTTWGFCTSFLGTLSFIG